MGATYTKDDWQGERAREEDGEQLSCPGCGRSEWYHPIAVGREDGSHRLYRACKVCGFWQDTGDDPYRCLPTLHICTGEIARGERCNSCRTWGPREWHPCIRFLKEEEITAQGYIHEECGTALGPEHRVALPAEPEM